MANQIQPGSFYIVHHDTGSVIRDHFELMYILVKEVRAVKHITSNFIEMAGDETRTDKMIRLGIILAAKLVYLCAIVIAIKKNLLPDVRFRFHNQKLLNAPV